MIQSILEESEEEVANKYGNYNNLYTDIENNEMPKRSIS